MKERERIEMCVWRNVEDLHYNVRRVVPLRIEKKKKKWERVKDFTQFSSNVLKNSKI